MEELSQMKIAPSYGGYFFLSAEKEKVYNQKNPQIEKY